MNYIEQFMKDNGIEVNEEFYVINEEGEKIKNISDDEHFLKFHFTEKLEFKSELINLICTKVLLSLMLGRCKIKKIPHKHKNVWDLKEEDMYYYINCYGEIDSTFYDCEEDLDIIKCGNAFLTREEADFEVERRKCEAILLKYGTMDMVSFEDYDDKYYILYDNTLENVDIACCTFKQNQGTIYFKSKELVQKAINECGEDRLKKYVFNVKE